MFQISPLQRERFDDLLTLDDDALARRGAKRYVVNKTPGFPCRVSLEDAAVGERVILVPFAHQAEERPYRASGPVIVREAARTAAIPPDTVPDLLRSRLLSVRAYDATHLMIDADVVEGRNLETLLERLLANERVSYAHIHFARPGCFACRVTRVP